MKHLKIANVMQFPERMCGLIRMMCLVLCASLMIGMASCAKNKRDDKRIVSVDDPYFSLHTIDFSEAAEGEYADIKCVKQLRYNLAILISGTSKYYMQFYDKSGNMFSQITLSDAINPESSVADITDDSNGNLYVLTQSVDQTGEKPVYELYVFNSKGMLAGAPIPMPVDGFISQGQMEVDYKGNIYLRFSSNSTGMQHVSVSGSTGTLLTLFGTPGSMTQHVSVFSSSGTPMYEISGESGETFGSLIDIEDQMYLVCREMTNQVQNIGLYPFDHANGKLGDPIDLTNILGSDSGTLIRGGDDELYWRNAAGVYSVNLQNRKISPLFLWGNTNYRNRSFVIDELLVLSDDTAVIYERTDYESPSIFSASLLTREAKNPDAGKEIITVSGSWYFMNSGGFAAIEKFNINSDNYRVEIYEYYEEVQSGMQADSIVDKIKLDILSGDGPDIVIGDQELLVGLEKKGVLSDLYPLMRTDIDFNEESVLPSILRICETDGHLYKLGTGFVLGGLIGAQSMIGDRTGWTVDEFDRFAESLPDTVTPLAGFTQSDLLYASLDANMNSYVETASGTLSFDSENFRKLLEYAKTYGAIDDTTDTILSSRSETTANGEPAIKRTGIYSPESYAQAVMEFGEPVSITGYPSPAKSTASCYMSFMIAISSESADIAGAWNFMKYFFTENVQNTVNTRDLIPVVTSIFDAQIEAQLHYDPDTGKTTFYDDWTTPMYVETDVAEGYRNLIYGLDSLDSRDSEILNIVMDEVLPYFNNQKTQDEVILLIQNRVQTLTDERMQDSEEE